MPANRKHHAIDTASDARWKLLGIELRRRRSDLGYRHRPPFAGARLPRTKEGNLMIRAVNAIELGERPGSYTEETMNMYARAYGVTLQSVFDFLEEKADELKPTALTPVVSVNAAPGRGVPEDGEPLFSDPAEVAADRKEADGIHRRLRELIKRGIEAEAATGRQVFPRPDEEYDARFWDKNRRDMWDLEHRIWLAARVRRQRAAQRRENLPDAG